MASNFRSYCPALIVSCTMCAGRNESDPMMVPNRHVFQSILKQIRNVIPEYCEPAIVCAVEEGDASSMHGY